MQADRIRRDFKGLPIVWNSPLRSRLAGSVSWAKTLTGISAIDSPLKILDAVFLPLFNRVDGANISAPMVVLKLCNAALKPPLLNLDLVGDAGDWLPCLGTRAFSSKVISCKIFDSSALHISPNGAKFDYAFQIAIVGLWCDSWDDA